MVIAGLSFLLLARSYGQSSLGVSKVEEINAELQKTDLDRFIAAIHAKELSVPYIPSAWFVRGITNAAQQKSFESARSLGRDMALRLVTAAEEVRSMVPSESLEKKTMNLCDLSDWLAATNGYGNLFLAQRCLDIAAVGAAKLAANISFPADKCSALARRFDAPWMSAGTRARLLNDELAIDFFKGTSQEELESAWSTAHAELTKLTVPSHGKIGFCDDDEISGIRPVTLVTMWDKKWHERIVNGLELRNVAKARALITFRTTVGEFPLAPSFTDEEIKDEKALIEANARKGIKVVSFADAYHSPGEAAFAQAWKKKAVRPTGMSNSTYETYVHIATTAWTAFDEVTRGKFADEDFRETNKE